jgi:glycosyltransferase 2 family protein
MKRKIPADPGPRNNPPQTDQPPSQRIWHRITKWLQPVVSYSVAAVCLYWVFHNIHLPDFLRALADIRWLWVAPSLLLNLLIYVCAAWEWQLLLRPVGRMTLAQSIQTLFAGRFANDVLPLHIGYLCRIYLGSRDLKTRATTVVYSLVVERLFDGFWIALGIGLTALFFPLPDKLKRTAVVWGAVILAGTVGFLIIVLKRSNSGGSPWTFLSRWKPFRKLEFFFAQLTDGLRTIGKSPLLFGAFGISFLKFGLQAGAFLTLLWAYGFHFAFWIQMAVFLIAYVGISVPSTPASVGVFQLFCVAGLTLLHVPKSIASGFGVFAFGALTLPLSIVGFFAVAQTGMTLSQIRAESRRWRQIES